MVGEAFSTNKKFRNIGCLRYLAARRQTTWLRRLVRLRAKQSSTDEADGGSRGKKRKASVTLKDVRVEMKPFICEEMDRASRVEIKKSGRTATGLLFPALIGCSRGLGGRNVALSCKHLSRNGMHALEPLCYSPFVLTLCSTPLNNNPCGKKPISLMR